MKKTQLFLIRHGETNWNSERRVQGHYDSTLSEQGVEEAKKLAVYLRDFPIDKIYASDLSRAYKTAEYIAKPKGFHVEKCSELRERYYGKWEGLDYWEVSGRYTDHNEVRHKGGKYGIEPSGDLQLRVVNKLKELVQANLGKSILVVSHGGCIREFLNWITNGEMDPKNTIIKNTSISRFNYYQNKSWEILDVNSLEHLVL